MLHTFFFLFNSSVLTELPHFFPFLTPLCFDLNPVLTTLSQNQISKVCVGV